MSTIKSSDEHLTLNADGSSKDIKFQANGVEKASISSSGAFTSTTIDATKLTGNLPAINGASLTGLPNGSQLDHSGTKKIEAVSTGASIFPTTGREAKIRVEDEGTDDAIVLSSYHASNGNLREVGLEGWKIRMYAGGSGGTSSVRGFEMNENRHATFWNTGNTVPTNEAVHHIINNNDSHTLMVDSTATSGQSSDTLRLQNSQDSNNGSYDLINGRNGGGKVFHVQDGGNVKNTSNSYGAISDERIKQDIADASSQWDDIKAVKVRKYKLKKEVNKAGADNTPYHIGVVAQELESAGISNLVDESKPEKEDVALHADFGTIVTGTADNGATPIKNEEGNITGYEDVFTAGEKVKEVKYSILYMKSIKALQEAMARIETLEAKVAALES